MAEVVDPALPETVVGGDEASVLQEPVAFLADAVGPRERAFAGFGDRAEVVGIVGYVRYGQMDESPKPDVYISYLQSPRRGMTLSARTSDSGGIIGGFSGTARPYRFCNLTAATGQRCVRLTVPRCDPSQ